MRPPSLKSRKNLNIQWELYTFIAMNTDMIINNEIKLRKFYSWAKNLIML